MSQEKYSPQTQLPSEVQEIPTYHVWDVILRKLDEHELLSKLAGYMLVLSTIGMGATLLIKHFPKVIEGIVAKATKKSQSQNEA